MDCRAVVVEIVKYFIEGTSREGTSFFHKSFDPLKETLRKEYFDGYRKEKKFIENPRPRTGDFISIVYSEILFDIREGRGFSFNEGDNFKNLVDRCLDRIGKNGYGYLVNGTK